MAYRSKSDWAAEKVQALRAEADQLRRHQVPSSDWQGVRRKMRALATLRDEIRKFERIAARYREAA